MDFYQGKVLRIDLNSGEIRVDDLDPDWAALYIGGKGLLFRYLLEEMEPRLDPWSSENVLIIATGPFAGTSVATASRIVVGCKSPATGAILDSYAGGSFGAALKFAGYDMIIIKGRAPQPSVVWIQDAVVQLLSARKYWGMTTSRIEAALREDLNPGITVLSTGPAGETRIPWACVSVDRSHKAGRGGAGALMGAKNLKAIAVRGTGTVSVGDARAFQDDVRSLHEQHVFTEENSWAYEEGTPVLVDAINDARLLPTRNWSAAQFAEAAAINSEAFRRLRIAKRSCYQCGVACRNVHSVGGTVGEGPEFETIALCGANCGIGDAEALVKFNYECDEQGLDTISTGAVVALAMDLAEKGIHDFGLRFGQAEGYLQAPAAIARRDGVGSELALGVRALAAKYGRSDLAMEVKNLELPGYDPRGAFGMSLAYATSDRGACHRRSYTVMDEILTGALAPDSLRDKAAYVIEAQHSWSVRSTGVFCDFIFGDCTAVAKLMGHVWRREVTVDELMVVGERIWNLGRLFNVREGFEARDDSLPALLLETRPAGSSARAIGGEPFRRSLQEYYRLRGWDEAGVPTKAKLSSLYAADELARLRSEPALRGREEAPVLEH